MNLGLSSNKYILRINNMHYGICLCARREFNVSLCLETWVDSKLLSSKYWCEIPIKCTSNTQLFDVIHKRIQIMEEELHNTMTETPSHHSQIADFPILISDDNEKEKILSLSENWKTKQKLLDKVSKQYPKDGTPCLVKDAGGWSLRYADGKGKFYSRGMKEGRSVEWNTWVVLDINNLPIK